VWFGLLLLIMFTFQVKVGRLTNPLGTPITAPLVFGSHLLSLTEDGRNLLIWDASEGGECMSLCRDRAERLRSIP
jgi:hypothetical protein